jgi:hypothetical protein
MNRIELHKFNTTVNKSLKKLHAEVEATLTADELKDGLEGIGAIEAAQLQGMFAEMHEHADRIKAAIGKMYDWVRMGIVPEAMDAEGLELMKIEGLGRVSLTSDINLKVLDKDKSFEWLEEIGSGDLIAPTVNASSLKALIRRRMRDNEEIPEDVYTVTPFTRASITAS